MVVRPCLPLGFVHLLNMLLRIACVGTAPDRLRSLLLTRDTVVQTLLVSLCNNFLNDMSLLGAHWKSKQGPDVHLDRRMCCRDFRRRHG